MNNILVFSNINSELNLRSQDELFIITIANVPTMTTTNISAAAFADSKPHYELLNGLRGVAALMVILYHVFEGFATSPFDQRFNHGYLAVDFFFILSGFVVGYAYDDRWKAMKPKDFFKRRLIRLHPMIVLGVVLGVITFLYKGVKSGTVHPFPCP